MFRIGEFSRIARVSCRLLRHYEEVGLLRPALTDRDTGYRYYRSDQLEQLNRILILRDLGLSLAQITQLMGKDLPAAELRVMLEVRRGELARSLEEQSERLRQVESRLALMEEDVEQTDDVMLRAEPARHLLSLRDSADSFATAAGKIGEILRLAPAKAGRRRLGQLVVIAHAEEFEPDQLDLEIGFFVESADLDMLALRDGRHLTIREVPPIERLAACVRVGPPQNAHRTTAGIGRFVEANGYRIVGPNRELFLRNPHPDRMHEAIVEMQFPVEPAVATG